MAPVKMIGTGTVPSRCLRKQPVSTIVSVPCVITIGASRRCADNLDDLLAVFVRHRETIDVHDRNGINLSIGQT